MKSCWEILEIEPTDDLKTIKKAYSKKVKEYHPEDNPEMYQLVYEAYQNARARACNEISNNQFDLVNYEIEDEVIEEDNGEFFDFDQRQIDLIYQQVDLLYCDENINNVDLWQKLINDNLRDVTIILDYVLELGLDKLSDERVVNCLNNCIKGDVIDYPKIKLFDQRYNELRKKAAKGYILLDYLFGISCLLTILVSLVAIVVSVFKAMFFNNQEVILNLLMFTVSMITLLQSSKTISRIYDSKAKFYYRNYYLVGQVVIWCVIDCYYLWVGYLYFFKELSYQWVLINLLINLVMYGLMHTKRYLKEVNRFIKPARDMTVLAVPYGLMLVLIILGSIYFMIKLYVTKNLEYFIILIAILAAFYSNSRAVLLAIKDKHNFYQLKNMNALLVVNGYCSVCCLNLMWHYVFNLMKFDYTNYLLVMSTIFLSFVCFGLYLEINIDRKKQYFETFGMDDSYQAVNRMYEFIKEKTNDGKDCKCLTIFELNYYLVGMLQVAIETEFADVFLNHHDLLLNIDEALIELGLDKQAQLFKEASEKLVVDGEYIENDDLLYFYQEKLDQDREIFYQKLNEYMVNNKRYFVYDKLKY